MLHSVEILDARTRARLAGNVKCFRVARGHSLAEAAKLAEVPPDHWQAVERGKLNPKLTTLVKIAIAFDVEPDELLKPVPGMAQATAASPAGAEGGRSGKEGA